MSQHTRINAAPKSNLESMRQLLECTRQKNGGVDLGLQFEVWTAALATWAVPEEFNLGPCNAADPMTFGITLAMARIAHQ
eukprot:1468545-Amphidinium_carterae.2